MSTLTAKETTIASLRPQQQDVANLPVVSVGLTSLQGFELAQRAAKLLASSTLVPKEYQGNLSNCVIALNMAARVGADPLMVMQNLVIVHGRPTWSSQFLIATVNTCGRFSALRYEFFGQQGTDGWGCRAWAIEKATGEKLVGTDITIAIAKKEGWYGKNGSKWQSIPQQMLMYRAGSWWTRAYAPELSMGLHTAEEMRDFIDAEKLDDGSYAVTTEALRKEAQSESAVIDAETGEVREEQKPVGDASAKEEAAENQKTTTSIMAEPIPFNLENYRLDTQTGTREAVKNLCALLEIYPVEERADVFVNKGGMDIMAVLGRHGIGTLRNRFTDLGLKLPPGGETIAPESAVSA